MTDMRNATDKHRRTELPLLVGLVVLILLVAVSPLGWGFLYPHLAATIVEIWNSVVAAVAWFYAAIIAPVLGVFA